MKRRFSKSIFFAALLVVVFFATTLITESSFAVPPFARKYKTSCQMCHSVPGALNGFGREFRRNGYVMPGNEPTESGDLMSEQIEELPGFGGLLEAEGKWYPQTSKAKTTGGDTRKTDIVVPEIEFFMAGNTGNVGYLVIFLADMSDKNVAVEAGQAQFNDVFGPKNAFNIKIGSLLGTIGHVDQFYFFKGIGTITPRRQADVMKQGDFTNFGNIDTFGHAGSGIEINGQFGNIYYGVGMTTGLTQDTEENDNNDFHKDFYVFLEFKHGSSGGGFWANEMINARVHFYKGTEDNSATAFNQWVKKMRIGLNVDFNYGPLITSWTFIYNSAELNGSGYATKKSISAINIMANVSAILMNGKFNPQVRFEYAKGTYGSGTTPTTGVDGSKYDSEMYAHVGFSTIVRSNIWAVFGTRLFLSADKYNKYKYATGAGQKTLIDVVEAKVVVAY